MSLIGGIPVSARMLYIYIEDRFIEYKKSEYSKTQKFVILRIFPPQINESSIHQMEGFFEAMWSIFRERTPFKLLTLGRSFENLTFEFHSKGGFVAIFVRINSINQEVLIKQLTERFPGIQIVEYPDPFANLPKDWNRKGEYEQIFASDFKPVEIETGKETDLFPLKSWKEYQTKDKVPISDPAAQLFGFLQSIDPKSYVVLQFITRPMYIQKQIQKWKSEYEKRKKEFLGEQNLKLSKIQKAASTTNTQKKILNDITRKINSLNYLCKIRAIAMAKKGVNISSLENMIMSYFVQFNTEMIKMRKQPDTQSDAGPEGKGPSALGPIMAMFFEKIYWERERYFREKMVYQGMIKRNIDIGSPYYYLDVESLASMIHFPYISQKDFVRQNLKTYTDAEKTKKVELLFNPKPLSNLLE